MRKNPWTQTLALSFFLLVSCQPRTTPKTSYWQPDNDFANALKKEENEGNGIDVGEPKIYDDTSLRQLLDAARLRLGAVNSVNEASLLGHLGATTGAHIDQSQFGLQASGPSLPGVSTVANGATTQNTTSTGDTSAGTTVVTTAPAQNVTTTTPGISPPASPSVPSGLAFAPPTGVSGSALDVLNEEMQLTYEIAGLQLLLEGSLSDRFVKNQRLLKPRATIGFPISLTPQLRYKNAVAVVEVEVTTAKQNLAGKDLPEPPAITALLPREKTYNVAAVTDHSTSIGGGVVLGVVGISGSYYSGHKTYYLVQDQDTVAIQRPSDRTRKNTTSFAWEFRPVLGQEFVRGGMKQTFVQLALPLLEDFGSCFGTIKIRTYWRRFDQASGIAGAVIKNSALLREGLAIPHYDLTPSVDKITYKDLGDGTLLVSVGGSFLSGTYVQLGPIRYDPTSGLRLEDSGMTFVAPANALSRWTGQVISRDGRSADLLDPSLRSPSTLDQFSCIKETIKEPLNPGSDIPKTHLKALRYLSPKAVEIDLKDTNAAQRPISIEVTDVQGKTLAGSISSIAANFGGDYPMIRVAVAPSPKTCSFGQVKIKNKGITVTPLNESTSEVRVEFDPIDKPLDSLPNDVFLNIGFKVFGMADTIVKRDSTAASASITAVVPTSLLVASRRVSAFRMFWTAPDGQFINDQRNKCFNDYQDLDIFGLDSAVERLTLVAVDNQGAATYLLYGNGLKGAEIVPPCTTCWLANSALPEDRIRLLKIDKPLLQAMKKLVLLKKDTNHPLVLDLPQPEPKPPKVTIDSPIIQNTDELDVPVENASNVVSIKMGDKDVLYDPPKGDSIHLKSLVKSGVTTEQKTRELTFTFKDKTKVSVKLDVVAARVGIKQ